MVRDDKLGIEVPLKSEICIGTTSIRKAWRILSNIKDEALFIKIGPWTSYRGIEIKASQEIVLSTFQKLFELESKFEQGLISNIKYLVVSGLLNLREEEIYDYLYILYGFLNYVDFLIFLSIGPVEEIEKLEKFCTESLRL